MSTNGTSLAAVAGVCAALAGLTAKYALSTENSLALIRLGENYIPSIFLNIWILKGILAAMTLALNSVMLTLTAKALQYCSTTVQSVITTSAINFLTTGLLGHLFLGEYIGWTGIAGMIIIQLGVYIVSKDNQKVKHK